MSSWSQVLTLSSASAWDEVFTDLHGASRIKVPDRHAPWSGRLEWQRSKSYGLALCSGGEEVVHRDARHIRSDPRGTYELLVPLAGTAWVEQGSSSGEIGPGSMALCDIDRPLTFAHGAELRGISFFMAGQNVAGRSPIAAGGPHILSGAGGLGRVVRQLTTTLHEEREQLSETTFDIACDRLLDLVCLAAEGGNDSAPTGQRATVEASIRRYVRRHACDRDLDVVGIARALGWSARYVQQVLQAANTTSRDLIRRERLNVARTRLVSASWSTYSIAEIAHSCGFGSHASFATAFREEFGTTPREARRSARGG
ncbi:AraC family transcriptional regulator [Streptomyces sp. NBC_00620]|uniref:AraC family transcriptional regulator n=1 Tax=Streptomyces sp. NBC_00620 TaxID=2903666 RepID=UPI00225878D1|nr:AraC family transcriptional regulator [Streptomyces sp. NBC_00620]MCX4979112.1 AraC family transcriptional regulator [Streptomyces sp. NBC_00620]